MSLEIPWKINWSIKFKEDIEDNSVRLKFDQKILKIKNYLVLQIMILDK